MPAFRTAVRNFSVIALGILFAVPGAAQRITSDILGTVTDPSGAVIVGASVTAIRTETGEQRSVSRDQNGAYRISPNHKILLRNTYTHDADKTAREFSGNDNTVGDILAQRIRFIERRLLRAVHARALRGVRGGDGATGGHDRTGLP